MKKLYTIFGIVLVLQLINIFVWASVKEGYYIDELWSYGLSNSYYEPFLNKIEEHEGNWHSPEYYQSYLVVDEGEAFTYASVYYNQVKDVHPPLYYFILHTVCSFFPGVFSKWFGLGVNIFFFIGSMWILLKLGQMIFDKECIKSIIPMALYGFSIGAMNTVLYIRMYMMLVFFVLLFVYVTLLWSKRRESKKLLWGIFAVSLAGFLTQYFFIIFIFFVVATVVLWLILKREWKTVLRYALTVVTGLLIGVGVFPAVFSHIFQGHEGYTALTQAIGAITEYGRQTVEYAKAISVELLCGIQLWSVFLLVLLAAFIITIIWFVQMKREKQDEARRLSWVVCATAVIGYFLVVVKLEPMTAVRYQCLIYPFFYLVAVFLIYILCEKIKCNWIIWIIVALGLVGFAFQYPAELQYLYPNVEGKWSAFGEKYATVPGVYVVEGSYSQIVINDCFYLQEQEQTYPIDAADITAMQQLGSELPDEIIVYLSKYYVDERLPVIMEYWDYAISKKVTETEFTDIILLQRQ